MSVLPTEMPSVLPSMAPTEEMSMIPSTSPSSSPSQLPSSIPSNVPSSFPSNMPSKVPTPRPSKAPTPRPTPTPAPTLECYGPDNCNNGAACFSNNCVTSLSFHLSWDGNDDHDLEVTPPNGSLVFFGRKSSGSCRLTNDDRARGNFKDSSTTVFTEIITCTDPPPGSYKYSSRAFRQRRNYDPYTLSIYVNGVMQHQAAYTSDSGTQTFTL